MQKSELVYSGFVTFSPDPSNPQGLKMINQVDIAWNEDWTNTGQTHLLSLTSTQLTIRSALIKNSISGELATSTLVFERSRQLARGP